MTRVDIDMMRLHPRLRHKLKALIKKCEQKGIGIGINSGYRSFAEQDELYAQGRTAKGARVTNAKGGYSQHNYGIAADFFRNEEGKDAYDNSDGWFKKVGRLAKGVGLGWGGDWKSFQDMPHLYLKDWGSTTQKIREKYKSYNEFAKTWVCTATYKKGTRVWKTKAFRLPALARLPKDRNCYVIYKSKFRWAKVEYKDVVGYAKKKWLKFYD